MPQIKAHRAAGYSREFWDMAAAFGSAETEFGKELSWLDAFMQVVQAERPPDQRRHPRNHSHGKASGKHITKVGKEMAE